MTIKEKIHEDLLSAQKEARIVETSVLRMVVSAFHNKEIEKRARLVKDKSHDAGALSDNELDMLFVLDEKEVMEVLRNEVKKRKEAIDLYTKGNRNDLVKKESEELSILERYLPKAPSQKELEEMVIKVIGEFNAKGKEDFGRVMKEVINRFEGRAEGSSVSAIIKNILQ